MSRATIDFGIDLGTTNSAIGVLRGTQIQIFKNNENQEYTPSAVWIDQNGELFVGHRAKAQLEHDPENAYSEFKLSMGQPKDYRFARSGRVMRPEELSAEVLKALKASVRQRSGEEVEAAVITVPAAFELPPCDATRKAAELAGLTSSPLLQEPIAAALAYGFQNESDKVFWLVYDLGGGTFDAAIIQVRDGQIRVVNHGGDNFLGGKLIDWAIVEQLFIPALLSQHPLPDFRRGNPRWRSALAKLKQRAEEGKIQVSSSSSVQISIEYLCLDDQNQPIGFEYPLKKSDVERLAEPFIVRSINLCKKTLADSRLGVEHIERVVMVGGPTLAPYLRERLADPKEGLGIPLEFQVDPLTVVAQGAAIYAGTQRLQKRGGPVVPARAGQFIVSFSDWQFMGSDTEPPIAGVVKAPAGESLEGFTIQFLNADARPQWQSGQMQLSPAGGFVTSLVVTKGGANRIQVELRDRTGRLQQIVTDPDPLTYLVGVDLPSPPLPHSVGVALANNEVEWFLEKGKDLPARRIKKLLTAFEVRQGQAGDVIRIPVVEGENPRADRNRTIGKLEVNAHEVKRNIPIGAEVEITIEIDQSRLLRTKAFVPLLDEEFENVVHFNQEVASGAALQKSLEQEKERLRTLRDTSDPAAQQVVEQIDKEHIVEDVAVAIDAMGAEPDAADRADKRLLDLKAQIDRIEEALQWPNLVKEGEDLRQAARNLITQHGNQEHRSRLRRVEAELDEAIQSLNADLLAQRIEALRRLVVVVLDEKGVLQVILFERLCEMRDQMRNQARANEVIVAGKRAIQLEETGRLRAINQELRDLLPNPPPEPDMSTVMRKSI